MKTGVKSVGVKRQYSGSAGRLENCQIGVFLAYRSTRGCAFLDRALFPTGNGPTTRRGEAKVPPEVAFAAKPQLAQQMLARALDDEVPAAWLTADEVYGSAREFRTFCEERRLNYTPARGWLVRRSLSDPTELAFFFTYAPVEHRLRSWSPSPAVVGRLKKGSSRPSKRPAWTNMKSGRGSVGNDT